MVALPAFALPTWVLGAALGAVVAGALAGSLYDFNYLDSLWNSLPEPTPPEIENAKHDLENLLPSMGYHPEPQYDTIPGFPETEKTRRKTHRQGGAGLRKRWKDKQGSIYEWDSQHGEIEKYDPRGKHQGSYDPNTGKQNKPAKPGRKVEP